ncbi:MAG: OmpA family protein, partial [Proteobacteria bacterium]|nr:OmpA family protein [Pseudomonadota bacterium]
DEYNLALGQRRGATVKRYLMERGVAGGRLEVVSYGEERPAAEGDDESAYSQNRRAEFEITAGGAWTIELAPLRDARRFATDGTVDGNGDDVVVADESTVDGSRIAISHSGGDNFAIWAYAETTTDLLVNDVGPYEGRARWPGGIVVLDITAGGPWTLAIE